MDDDKKRWLQTQTSMAVLRREYKEMVKQRTRGKTVLREVPCNVILAAAERLLSPKLATLFIRAQFHAMPPEWCKERFNKLYPPANVCFSGDCWVRYDNYLKRGVDDAS